MKSDVIRIDNQGNGFEDAVEQTRKAAAFSGVKIIASCHGKDITDLQNKDFFIKNVFERYVVLDAQKSAGTVKGFYDCDLNAI